MQEYCSCHIIYSMVVEPDSDQGAIDSLVAGFVPGAEVNRVHGKELDITLPQAGISNFAGISIDIFHTVWSI